MVKVVHYEVYTGRNGNWKIEGRYPSDQRDIAFILAKEKEKTGTLAVKVVREDFDIQDGSYFEAVEYVSGLSNNNPTLRSSKDKKDSLVKKIKEKEKNRGKRSFFNQHMFTAVLTLLLIILICLFLSNLIITLLFPVIEILVPEDAVKTVMFVIFFALFLIMAVPLVVNKVPWYAFVPKSSTKFSLKVYNKKLIDKAEAIIKRYNMNDNYEQVIAPSYPEASLAHKRYIVDFLGKVTDGLGRGFSLKDGFSKLGVKLIVYGGCMELSRHDRLKINEANSLLFTAFKIIDNEPDIIGFYEAKRSYNDNKEAIYLTGIGAYIMSLVIKKYPVDADVLKAGFEKWQKQGEHRESNAGLKKRVELSCLVNLKNTCRLLEDNDDDYREIQTIKKKTNKIISNILSSLRPVNIFEQDDFISINFLTLNEALLFSVRFFEYFSAYQESLNSDNVEIENKCSIIEHITINNDGINYIEDIFEIVYDNEIIVDDKIKDAMSGSEYNLDFLGSKHLHKTGKNIALYKLYF